MKLGNTSQSTVPVPNFFLNNSLNQMETFEVSDKKRYFREKDLFRMTKDINFCNNPRNFNRKHENFNKQKYIPDLTNINSILKSYSNNHYKKTHNYFSSPKHDSYEQYRSFLEKTNVTNFTNPNLKDEIKNNINVLINKIKSEYDLDKWAKTDTRSNFLTFNTDEEQQQHTAYDSSASYLMNNNYSVTKANLKNLKANETDAMKFKTILRDKVKTMSINKNLKEKLISTMDKFNDSSSDKFYKAKKSSLISKEAFRADEDAFQALSPKSKTRIDFKENNNLIDKNNKFNLSKVCLPVVTTKYSQVSQKVFDNLEQVEKLRKENKFIYQRFKDTSLYRDFPSPDRKEFVIKKGERLRNKSKKDFVDNTLVDFSKYNASKHKNVFCEDYDINEKIMLKFKKAKDFFI